MKRILAILLLLSSTAWAQVVTFAPGQVLTAAQLNTSFASVLPLTGGTLTGPLTAPTATFTNSYLASAYISGGTINNTVIGGTYPANGTFNNLNVTGSIAISSLSTSNAVISGGSINSTPVGNTSPSSGSFTTMGASGAVTLTNTTQSTSATTGALIVSGGVGIAKDIYSGGTFHGGVISTSGTIDSIPIGSTTPSTGAFTTLRATEPQYNVLIGGGASATFGVVAPSATSGVPLISQGSAANPAFGTVIPAGGGTGLTTITAHGVMLGEGTGNVATVGPSATIGQALISQGLSADPIFGYPTGTLIGFQRFTSSGTYTQSAGTNSVIVEIQGAGGAGGGAAATGAGQFSCGSGGAAGGYIRHRMTSGFSGATVTIGAAGSGSSGAAGAAGGNTSFAGITANGGSGGASNGPSTSAATAPSAGGTASGGSIINSSGAPGLWCVGNATLAYGGIGANSLLGAGGIEVANGTGGAATGYGAGGGGAVIGASSGAQTGGAGAQGVVIVWEYN
ncbi:hypothetical protein [Burkholderia ubonensis]|uniref:glycine-rich domain-containing protein n=1 Tax=Burkholderia ubonensis TaxID=101571 RepID=UPI000AE3DF14|nr:hypothetical protein [Burkholderia ubonensis]